MKKQIIVIEDSAIICEMVKFSLEQIEDVEVSVYQSSEEFLIQNDTEPNLIILDFHLNSQEKNAMNGVSFLKVFREKDADTPVVVFSGQKSTAISNDLMELGCVGYVDKSEDDFLDALTITAEQVLKRA